MNIPVVSPEAASEAVEQALLSTDADLLAARDQQRWGIAEDMAKLRMLQPSLPELPNAHACEIYEQIVMQEARLAGATFEEYDQGTALHDDQLRIIGTGRILADAQHATNPVRIRTGLREAADHGTAGLAAVLARYQSYQVVVPLGMQTSNANTAPEHPIKDALVEHFDARHAGFVSLHGCYAGKVTHPADELEVHAVIGLGKEPNEASWEVAQALSDAARERYGLRVIIGNQTPHFNMAPDPAKGTAYFHDRLPQLDRDDGKLKPMRLAALTRASTTTFMQQQAAARELPAFPSLQLEMSRSLRLTPEDAYLRDRSKEYVGVYLGYCLGSLAAEMCIKHAS